MTQPAAHHYHQHHSRVKTGDTFTVCLVTNRQQRGGKKKRWERKKRRLQTDRQAGRQRGSAERPTCYLLKVHIQLKLSRYGGAVLLAGFPAVAAACPLSGRGAAEAHVAELDVLSEEEPAICGHGTQSTSPQQPGTKQQPSYAHTSYLKRLKNMLVWVGSQIIPEMIWKLQKSVLRHRDNFLLLRNNMRPSCDGVWCEGRNTLEKQNNPTIQTLFDWWPGQTQLKGMLLLITSFPVTARQSAALRHSRPAKTTPLSPQMSHIFTFGFQFTLKQRSCLFYFLKMVAGLGKAKPFTCFFFLSSHCQGTSVPEWAEFKLSLSFSWLRFKLHFEVPDLNVAVVLMRGTLAFSEPAQTEKLPSS